MLRARTAALRGRLAADGAAAALSVQASAQAYKLHDGGEVS